MTDGMLQDALLRIADRAEQIEVQAEGMADRAIAGAARRRRAALAGSAVAAVAAVTAVAVPIAMLGHGPGDGRPAASGSPRPPVGHAALPFNTEAELALVRACFAGGDPGIPGKGKPALGKPNVADPGEPGRRVRDFRVLASYRDARGRAVLLGSTLANRVCSIEPSGRPHPDELNPGVTANRWYPLFSTFAGPVSVDVNMGGAVQNDPARPRAADVVAGRVTPDVARLTFGVPGGRTTEAALANGFFVWRIIRPVDRVDPNKNPPAWLTVRAYDRRGGILKTLQVML